MNLAETPTQQKFDQALKLLKSDKMRTFRISIETDSTIGVNRDEEKQERTEFLMAVAQFLQNAQEIGLRVPELVPPFAELLLFGVRGFRVGRSLEQSFETALQKLQEKLKSQEGKQDSPPPEIQVEQMRQDGQKLANQVKLQMAQLRQAQDKENNQLKAQLDGQKTQMDAMMAKFEAVLKAKTEERGQDTDLKIAQLETAGELAVAERKAQLEGRSHDIQEKSQALEARGQNIDAAQRQAEMISGAVQSAGKEKSDKPDSSPKGKSKSVD